MRKEIIRDGVKLVIVARECWEGEWELAVFNEHGIASNWMEVFSSGHEALEAGETAIDTEGTDPFTDMEGFEYLLGCGGT